MLEKKNIDQVFLEKLKDYEKDPPVFVWNTIENGLSNRRESFNVRTVFSAAAAVVVIVLSAWWMITDRSDQQVSPENMSAQFQISNQNETDLKAGVPEKAQPSAFATAEFAAKPSLAADKNKVESAGNETFPVAVENNFVNRMNSDAKFTDKLPMMLSLATHDLKESSLKTYRFEAENSVEMQPKGSSDLNKWSIGIQAGPVITTGLKSAEGLNTQAENTFSAGVTAGYKISKRLSVRSGILLNQVKQRSDFKVITPTDQSAGIITPSGMVNFDQAANSFAGIPVLKQKLSYLSVPLIANYKIIDKKISLGVNAGITADFLTENKAELPGSNLNLKVKTAEMRDAVWSGELGLELGYEIGKRITLTLEPHLKHYFQSLSSNSTFNFKPIQAGLITGVSYSFN